jgi:hypothetical protein
MRQVARSDEDAVRLVHGWNPRKRKMLRQEHIRIAWNRLEAAGWLA